MISGNIILGPYSEKGCGELTITDEGIHFVGKASPVGRFRGENVELDVTFDEIVRVGNGLGQFNITCKGYDIFFGKVKKYQEAFEYLKSHLLTPEQKAEKQAAKTAEWKAHLNDEHVIRCNVCGHVFCYTNLDVEANKQLQLAIADKEISAARNTLWVSKSLGGVQYQQAEMMKMRSKDFKHCPQCNSTDICEIPKAEPIPAAETPAVPAASAIDELKKLKELLDMGIVTQEEFDAKKKQLLGL